jgi:hypothetical protein
LRSKLGRHSIHTYICRCVVKQLDSVESSKWVHQMNLTLNERNSIAWHGFYTRYNKTRYIWRKGRHNLLTEWNCFDICSFKNETCWPY